MGATACVFSEIYRGRKSHASGSYLSLCCFVMCELREGGRMFCPQGFVITHPVSWAMANVRMSTMWSDDPFSRSDLDRQCFTTTAPSSAERCGFSRCNPWHGPMLCCSRRAQTSDQTAGEIRVPVPARRRRLRLLLHAVCDRNLLWRPRYREGEVDREWGGCGGAWAGMGGDLLGRK